jgi:hypothetical protein
MYRCYLVSDGRISLREDPDVETLDDAIARCRASLSAQAPKQCFSGFEIWCGTSLIHSETTGPVRSR